MTRSAGTAGAAAAEELDDGSGQDGPHGRGPVGREPAEAGVDWQPWTYGAGGEEERRAQERVQERLRERHPGWSLGDGVFVSALAALDADELVLGSRSYVAAHAHVTGSVRTGADCSLNASCAVRGDVRLGDGVRVGAHAAILGFNHTTTDPDVPVFRQPLVSRGVVLGDDVWVGSHVVVLDGVRVGSRAVLAAGAVVTKDVPQGAVVGGNPARLLKWRVPPTAAPEPERLAERLQRFGDRARADGERVLARCWRPTAPGARGGGAGWFTDTPGAPVTVRAQCDAVEVADLLLGGPPPQLPAADQAARLVALQDPVTGLVPRVDDDGVPAPSPPDLDDEAAMYHVLCTGYALDLLGSAPEHPVAAVAALDADALVARLDALPWHGRAWSAGAWVDAVATALHRDRARGPAAHPGAAPALLGWLLERADPVTGLWGGARAGEGALQTVNGAYRAARGSLGQWGLPLPHPAAVVDSVLAHAADPLVTAPRRQDACAVLDVAWLLRAAGRSTDHRREEVRALAARLLDDALPRWRPGEGFAFRAADDVPGLQGTEMWLAVVHELASLLDLQEALGYEPRGVHRPGPR
ncbi:acyltransferase [Pseudokineococcus marinus]|uniref:Acyltransferase n=1 Tax=Pseudokineococcus marinus TaxID=351215 RepID=A0A849BQI4_9ACTN|nr:acyltransferase [Pseudokineococcus marinus]NNH23082.1 acyltransferase [Pseudokineococcus marinus]